LACAIFSVSEICYRYEAKCNAENELITNWLIRLTDNNRSWGFNREASGIEVGFSLPSERVIRALDQIITWRGKPTVIRADNGPELMSVRLMEWAAKQQIHIQHIQPGKPQ
jgi:transposase InsO family protein